MMHYILMRWNLPSAIDPGRLADEIVTPAWLRYRREVFLRYCLPSVVRQTAADFQWLFLMDAGSSAEEVAWFSSLDPRLRVIPVHDRGSVGGTEAREIVCAETADQDWIATTRLDSDDLLHPDYLCRVQETHDGEKHFVQYEFGYYYDINSRRLCSVREPHNAFTTLIEKPGQVQTIWDWEHNRIYDAGLPVVSIQEHGWMATVHERNSSTRMCGSPVADEQKRNVLREFGIA